MTSNKSKERKEKKWLTNSVTKHQLLSAFFGFRPTITPTFVEKNKKSDPNLSERESVLAFISDNSIDREPLPAMIVYERPIKGSPIKKEHGHTEMGFEIIGSDDPIGEALMIETMRLMLEESGIKSISVELNNIGDKESVAKMERDLQGYFRKNINILPANLRELFKKDIWNILRTSDKKAQEFFDNAPQALNTLSDIHKQNFKKVVEYMESSEIQYEINPKLIFDKEYARKTQCLIYDNSGKKPVVVGKLYRYGHLAKKAGFKKELPALCGTLSFKPKKKITGKPIASSKIPRPHSFFIQLSRDAKRIGVSLLYKFAKAKIMVGHALMKEKISSQMLIAEKLKVPYILIVGQREALDKTVVLRNTTTHSQEALPIENIVSIVKKTVK